MRARSRWFDKANGQEINYNDLSSNRQRFNSYDEYEKWRDDNYYEKIEYYDTPYEICRASAYATGNRWAIENFNATHN